jgi:hypothetical protein
MTQATKTNCCPPLDVSRWNEKTHHWREKRFITDNVIQVCHIPLNIGRVIRRIWNKALAAKATLPADDTIILAYDPSPWRSELFLSVSNEVPNATNVQISGEFFSKVFEGPYHAVPKWLREMDALLATQGKKSIKYYIHYAYCPKCARAYGKNQSVVFAQL